MIHACMTYICIFCMLGTVVLMVAMNVIDQRKAREEELERRLRIRQL